MNFNNKNIVLYGAGTLGKQVLAGLQQKGFQPVAFVEDCEEKRFVAGLPVLPLPEAHNLYRDESLYIISILNANFSYKQAVKKLAKLGLKNVMSFMAFYAAFPESFLPYYCIGRPEILSAAADKIHTAINLLSDKQSRDEFLSHMHFRRDLQFSVLPEPSTPAYFPSDLFPKLANDISFVDLGAFNGDTVKLFLQRTQNKYGKIWALEPDAKNFTALLSFAESLDGKDKEKISCLNLAIGDQVGEIGFHSEGSEGSCYSADSGEKVQTITLDSFFLDKAVSFIKFDIEGMEMQALAGGQKLIASKKPVLAVAAYHKPEDLWEIPIYIKSLNPGYRLYLRTEGYDGMGLVYYAV